MTLKLIGSVTPYLCRLAAVTNHHFDFYNAKINDDIFTEEPGNQGVTLGLITLSKAVREAALRKELRTIECRPATLREGLGTTTDGYFIFMSHPLYLMLGSQWMVHRTEDVFSPIVFLDGHTRALGLQRVSNVELDPTIPILVVKR